MRTHVSDDRIVELLDGPPDPETGEHLRSCRECAWRLEEARQGLALAREADVPEPPPLYWDALQRQVGRRLGEARRPWRWLVGPALAALAMGLAFVALPSRNVTLPPAPLLPAWSALPPAEDDPGLDVVQAVATQLEPEAACARLEDCIEDLSDEEGGALAELVRRAAPGRSS